MPDQKSKFSLPEPTWAIAGLIVAWGLLISQVRHHWGGESYYNFGYFVPPLAIFLFLRNLSHVASDFTSRHDENRGINPLTTDRFAIALAALTLVPVILFHALSEVNPFWRVPLWAQGCCL